MLCNVDYLLEDPTNIGHPVKLKARSSLYMPWGHNSLMDSVAVNVISAVDAGEWSNSHPIRFTSVKETR